MYKYNKKAVEVRQRRLSLIIECMNEGLTTKQMAEEFGRSQRTIQKDIKYILENQES